MPTPLQVLLVEDSQSDAELIRYHLGKADFTVTSQRVETAEAMQSALEKQSWDLIISDYNLRYFSALAALRLLQQNHLDIPFIIVSSTITEETAIDLMRCGAADYLMKNRLACLETLVKRELNITQVRREREEWSSVIFNSTTDAMFLLAVAPSGFRYLSVNAAFVKSSHRPESEIIGKQVEQILPQHVLPFFLGKYQEAVQSGRSVHYQGRVEFSDDMAIFETIVTPIFDPSGNCTQLLGSAREVTVQKQIEESLRQSEMKFSTAFRVSPDAININRLDDGLFIEVNEGFEKLTGYTSQEVIGKTSLEINIWHNPHDRERLVRILLEKGEVSNLEAPFCMKDGTIKTCLMSASIIKIKDEQCLLSITRDITERKQAEEALRESEQNFREIFNSTSEAIFIDDAETGQMIDVNDTMLKIYGYESKEEVLAGRVGDFSADTLPFTHERAQGLIRKTVQEGPQVFEWLAKRRDGSNFWVEISLCKSQIGSKGRVLAVARDITERKLAETINNEQMEELRRWYAITLGREGRICELKREVNELLSKAGQQVRYPSVEENPND